MPILTEKFEMASSELLFCGVSVTGGGESFVELTLSTT